MFPVVSPAEEEDFCEFQWLVGSHGYGSMVDPYHRGQAEVKLDLGDGPEGRCMNHAVWDLAEFFLQQLGTRRGEFREEIQSLLDRFLTAWIRHRLVKERVAARS